jgi:hypothetical protein
VSTILDDRKFEGMHQHVFWNNKFFKSEDVNDEDMHLTYEDSTRKRLESNPPELDYTPQSGVIASHVSQLNKLFKKIKNETGPFNIVLYSRDGGIQLEKDSMHKSYRTKQGYCITYKINGWSDTLNRIPKNVNKIFCSNVDLNNHRIVCFPYGAAEECSKEIETILGIREMDAYGDLYLRPRKLCYVNFNVKTNRKHRIPIWNKMQELDWVDIKSGLSTQAYIKDLFSYKYVVCPKGNGIDTMRMWESLYCGAIPIVARSGVSSCFSDLLPMVEVDNWNLDKEYLESIYYLILH